MAGGSLLMLLDDIATVLDDVALMTKVAARKTAGVLGDDLAVNAEKVTGVRAERELPVVWAVAKGSLRNKCILVPAALAVSAVVPWLINPVLIAGGLFLCFEGFEKVAHTFMRKAAMESHVPPISAVSDTLDVAEFERKKIQGAVRTDFILSLEIIVITLGIVAAKSLLVQSVVVSAIAVMMTAGVYGVVAGIVKLDDAGFYLLQREGGSSWARVKRWFGARLIAFAPWLMKFLGVVGTVAMFMVGGGILVHGFHLLGDEVNMLTGYVQTAGVAGPMLAFTMPTLAGISIGVLAGAIVFAVVSFGQRIRSG